MDKSKQKSIDIKNLADSLRAKLESLGRLPEKCCIYRVPQQMRCLNPSAYSPKLVSIGPLHHDNDQLKAMTLGMEELKFRNLQNFLRRTKVTMEEFLGSIRYKEAELRNCYSETVGLDSDVFVAMIFVDAVFVLEFLLRYGLHKPQSTSSSDSAFMKSLMTSDLWPDIWLLENQLPLFILNHLFIQARQAMHRGDEYDGVSLLSLTRLFYKRIHEFPSIEEDSFENHFSKAKHFLDLLRLCFQPSQPPSPIKLKTQSIPAVTELHQAGVKFKLGSSKNLFDITFSKGVLEIPLLRVTEYTETLFRNLHALERLHSGTSYINDYVILMNYLVNTRKDVELLIQKEIIENWLWNNEAVSILFHNLVKGTSLSPNNFQYSRLTADLKAYCRHPWPRWKTILKQNYFNNPWASISVAAAVILLVLTFIQSLKLLGSAYSVYSSKNSFGNLIFGILVRFILVPSIGS